MHSCKCGPVTEFVNKKHLGVTVWLCETSSLQYPSVSTQGLAEHSSHAHKRHSDTQHENYNENISFRLTYHQPQNSFLGVDFLTLTESVPVSRCHISTRACCCVFSLAPSRCVTDCDPALMVRITWWA